MSLISLIVKLAVDSTMVKRGVNEGVIAYELGQKRMAALAMKFGKMAAVGGVVGALYGLKRVVYDAQNELNDLARAEDVTVTQMRRMKEMAAASGESWDNWKKTVEDAHGSLKAFADTNEKLKTPNPVLEMMGEQAKNTRAGVSVALENIWKLIQASAAFSLGGFAIGKVGAQLREPQQKNPVGFIGPPVPPGFIPPRDRTTQAWETSAQRFEPQRTEWQRIGAFSPLRSDNQEIKTLVKVSRDSNGNLKKIAENTGKLVAVSDSEF